MLSLLPLELLNQIILDALQSNVLPTSLLAVNSVFHSICLRALCSDLTFNSVRQLTHFNVIYARAAGVKLPHPPSTITIHIPGEALNAFSCLVDLLAICRHDPRSNLDEHGRLMLDRIELRMNSFSYPQTSVIEVFASINPHAFIWTSPDPPHHFALTIVPMVLESLFEVLPTYTNLSYLKLTNFKPISVTLPPMPNLRHLYLGSIVFLKPEDIVQFVLSSGSKRLEWLKLVDAYRNSIWGPRVRDATIEEAAVRYIQASAALDGIENGTLEMERLISDAIHRVRSVVICGGLTERIIGGDRFFDED